ncbi:MAG TPA: hypothetical protein VNO14_06855, partial [Blastocatellia bacterium]|nr:hypothetical protein [Blastocatellia bacterium]
DPQLREDFPTPRINDHQAVAIKLRVDEGSASSGIFLASTRAMVKVVAVGDKLPSGGKIRDITSFALNDFGQVAFYAEVNNGPKGVIPRHPALAPHQEGQAQAPPGLARTHRQGQQLHNERLGD